MPNKDFRIEGHATFPPKENSRAFVCAPAKAAERAEFRVANYSLSLLVGARSGGSAVASHAWRTDRPLPPSCASDALGEGQVERNRRCYPRPGTTASSAWASSSSFLRWEGFSSALTSAASRWWSISWRIPRTPASIGMKQSDMVSQPVL
eukprot:scaffold1638_cov258-Pinguiococcus_pyrenoidosus.AAC.38